MQTPGATTSGFTRPSKLGPSDEKFATAPAPGVPLAPVVDAPTAMTFFAVAGEVTWEAPDPPRSPTEKMGVKSLRSWTKVSTERASAVYCP